MVPSNRAIKHIQNQLWSISLKVLAFTIFLNTIDLSTDFAQSYLLYQDPALIEYGKNELQRVVPHIRQNHSTFLESSTKISLKNVILARIQGSVLSFNNSTPFSKSRINFYIIKGVDGSKIGNLDFLKYILYSREF